MMALVKRTFFASAVALAALSGGTAIVAPLMAPLAQAEDTSPEQQFKYLLDMQGVPPGILKWSGVEATPTGLVVHGLYADLSSYKLGFDSLPLGDLDLSEIQTQDNKYITHLKARFSGITVDMAALMATGQKMGQAPAPAPGKPNPAASVGMGLAMGSGYVQGLGYKTLNVTMGFEETVDLASTKAVVTSDIDIADAFKFGLDYDLTGVDAAYLDWAKANAAKMYLDHSPEATAQIQKEMADPSSPIAKVGFSRYAVDFTDQGLMPKLEPQLAPMRAQMLGVNPDGSPKTAYSDDDIKKASAAMAAQMKMTPEKIEPLVRAFYNFVMTPKHIAVTVKFNPPFTLGELMSLTKPVPGAPAPAIDWNSRLSFEASN